MEALNHGVGFGTLARMLPDGVHQITGSPIMQKEDALSQAPQRSRPELVRPCRSLCDAVSQPGSHVVHYEVRERVDLRIRLARRQ